MRFSLIVIVLLSFLSGCSSLPSPLGHEYSNQKKMQAASHWNVLALDLANKINNELIRNDFLNVAVFVQDTCGSDSKPCSQNQTTQFNEGFRDLLVTQLVNYGIPTKTEVDRDVIMVNYKVQLIQHREGRAIKPPTGATTFLTAAVTVLRNAPTDVIAIALAGVFDYYNTTTQLSSNYEVIITTSMVSKKKYIFRSSDIYYINDADFWHYRDFKSKNHTIQLTNSQKARSTQTEDVKVPSPSPPSNSLQDI